MLSLAGYLLIGGAVDHETTENGSYTHRLGALSSLKKLYDEQPSLAVMVGNGAASEPRLYAAGLLQNDGLQAVDDEYVDTIAQAGIIGLACFVVALGSALLGAGSATVLAGMFLVVAEGAVFDILIWPSTAVLVGLFIGFGSTERRRLIAANPGMKPATARFSDRR
ncbi:MAG TPA: hypothetical protein VIJ50_02295 [Solirubrobacteraceae bacterium]